MEQHAEEIGLVVQALGGDQPAFARLMGRYAGAVYNLAYRMLGNAQDAEDAAQEIFLRAYTRLESFDRTRRFSTWLLSIASNYCIDRLRRQRLAWLTLDDVAFSLPSGERGPEGRALDSEERDAVQRALMQLPDTYRQVTVLRYWHDLSYDEIAQATGLTESTIKTRLHRARHMLARALRAEGIAAEEATASERRLNAKR
ncbi:MAG TPA: sigma-70 family RNA polymerase sigma factor [Roseiflexaceae bacterium]|nr:sigma-70 family RNA polymerase sigma factor [Roseiflexaceae bacterium]